MMLEGLSHAPFIAAAYAIFFIVLAGLAVLTFRRARDTSQQLQHYGDERENAPNTSRSS